MSELKWEKIGKSVNEEGTTITYQAAGTGLTIESRKRHIPHANREGTWDHTTFFVLVDGKKAVETWSLGAAKGYTEDFAEQLYKEKGEEA